MGDILFKVAVIAVYIGLPVLFTVLAARTLRGKRPKQPPEMKPDFAPNESAVISKNATPERAKRRIVGIIYVSLIVALLSPLLFGIEPVDGVPMGIRKMFGQSCFQHSFGHSCEYKAPDAGQQCRHNGECTKYCVYTPISAVRMAFPSRDNTQSPETGTNPHAYINQPIIEFQILGEPISDELFDQFGKCDAFWGDNDGEIICTRQDEQSAIDCGMEIS